MIKKIVFSLTLLCVTMSNASLFENIYFTPPCPFCGTTCTDMNYHLSIKCKQTADILGMLCVETYYTCYDLNLCLLCEQVIKTSRNNHLVNHCLGNPFSKQYLPYTISTQKILEQLDKSFLLCGVYDIKPKDLRPYKQTQWDIDPTKNKSTFRLSDDSNMDLDVVDGTIMPF